VSDLYDSEPSGPSAPALVAIASVFVFGLAILLLIVTLASRRTADQGASEPPRAELPAGRRHLVEPRPSTYDPDTLEHGLGSILIPLLLFIAILMAVAWILMLVFVVKDCRNRSVDNGALWMLTVAFTHFVGLLVYLASRPPGSLIGCEYCGNRRLPYVLPYVAVCPHCRREVKPH
jgi:uncharacterized membrane protein YhaH (DUF805 family)